MSWLLWIAVGLGALAGVWLLTRLIALVVLLWARKKLSTAGFCEFCFKEPAVFLANFDDGAPLGMCETCRAKKLGPFLTERWLEQRKLVPIGKAA